MKEFDKTIMQSELFCIYGCLLTNTQKSVLEDYYFNDLSFSEIAEKNNCSRQAVCDMISKCLKKLNNYESKLKILLVKNSLNKLKLSVDTNTEKQLDNILENFNGVI